MTRPDPAKIADPVTRWPVTQRPSSISGMRSKEARGPIVAVKNSIVPTLPRRGYMQKVAKRCSTQFCILTQKWGSMHFQWNYTCEINGWFQRNTYIASLTVTWPMTSQCHKPKRSSSWPQYLWGTTTTLQGRRFWPHVGTVYWKSYGHVTDDVTWPPTWWQFKAVVGNQQQLWNFN